MNIQSEKLELIQWLINLNDENVIARIKSLRDEDADWWDSLSTEETKAIREGLEQLDRGEGIPHSQVAAEAKNKYGL